MTDWENFQKARAILFPERMGRKRMIKNCIICGEKFDWPHKITHSDVCSETCLNVQMMQQTRVERLLEMYWNIMNRAPLQLRTHTESELRQLHRYEAEMLFRVDQRIMPADALPPNVYQTWCKITRQEKPKNWKVDCGNACAVAEPYGWVPEDGCPVHDADLENDWTKGPFGRLDELPGEDARQIRMCDDNSGIEIDGHWCARRGDACVWCSLVNCRSNPDHREWIGKNRMKSAETFGINEHTRAAYEKFGIDIDRAHAVIDELRMSSVDRTPVKPVEHRCGIVLLLSKLAAVADDYARLPLASLHQQNNALNLAQLAIKVSKEIEESVTCVGLDCNKCAHWAPGEL